MIPLPVIFPELVLVVAACALFLVGVSPRAAMRRITPVIALVALAFVFFYQMSHGGSSEMNDRGMVDPTGTFRIGELAQYIKLISAGVGILFVLLSWPTNRRATANSALSFGNEAGEYFAFLLLSISGIFIVAGANDIILLFLGVELASIPTYIMVSVSRPLPVAQEAGVKYFFLGAMSAAIMLFGFSYLYGTTGETNISAIAEHFAGTLRYSITPAQSTPAIVFTPWQMLAAVMIIAGLAFKMAAVPLHFYAADVYQGAATPVTALLSFVPKTSGFVALIKVLYALGGGTFAVPGELVKLIWVLAVLTMTVGNVLGLLQANVKRVLAYSSVAHSGYMLAGITAMISAKFGGAGDVQQRALAGVLFYLASYGIMNAGAFGVLMLLPARAVRRYGEPVLQPNDDLPPACAETYEDLAGTGRQHLVLGLAMAVSCFSLIGLPLTVGFFAKFYLIGPMLLSHNIWLTIVLLINAVIGAVYYLKIVGTMFLRPEPALTPEVTIKPESAMAAGMIEGVRAQSAFPVVACVALSCLGTLLFGMIFPATQDLSMRANIAATPLMSFPQSASDQTGAPSAPAPDENFVRQSQAIMSVGHQ
jgi:NADH-quinone oxidoreductase subunit N